MSNLQRPFGPTTSGVTGQNPIALNTSGAPAAVLPVLFVVPGSAEVVVPSNVVATIPLLCAIEPNANLEQIPFELNWSGYIKTAASMTVTLKLYQGTSLTPGSNSLMLTSGAITQNSATAPFFAYGKFVYDSVSGKLMGTVEYLINNTIVAKAAVSTVITTVNNVNNPVVVFCVSVTFSVANAANAINTQNLSVG